MGFNPRPARRPAATRSILPCSRRRKNLSIHGRQANNRFSALAALGVGAAAGATAYLVGPLIAAAAGLAGSTLRLAAMADAARCAAAVLHGAGAP